MTNSDITTSIPESDLHVSSSVNSNSTVPASAHEAETVVSNVLKRVNCFGETEWLDEDSVIETLVGEEKSTRELEEYLNRIAKADGRTRISQFNMPAVNYDEERHEIDETVDRNAETWRPGKGS